MPSTMERKQQRRHGKARNEDNPVKDFNPSSQGRSDRRRRTPTPPAVAGWSRWSRRKPPPSSERCRQSLPSLERPAKVRRQDHVPSAVTAQGRRRPSPCVERSRSCRRPPPPSPAPVLSSGEESSLATSARQRSNHKAPAEKSQKDPRARSPAERAKGTSIDNVWTLLGRVSPAKRTEPAESDSARSSSTPTLRRKNHIALRRGALRRRPKGANHTALSRGGLRRTVVTVPPCGNDRASAAVLLKCHAAVLVHQNRKMQQLRQDSGGQGLKPRSSLPCNPGRKLKQAPAGPRCRKTTSW